MTIRLAYYPPYHSKYNLIERCWGVLENHWNGALLDSIPTALRFAQTMTWHGKHPFVELIEKIYQRGVKLTAAQMKELETQVQRLPGLEKWFVDIPRVTLGELFFWNSLSHFRSPHPPSSPQIGVGLRLPNG